MHVVVAPDKFKGCLSAADVADAIATGLRIADPDVRVTELPVADGGEGTVAATLAAGFTEVRVRASGPTGLPVDTRYALRDLTAVVELAAVVGLDLLPDHRPQPLATSTYGFGEVIAHALRHGAREVILAVGGSASTDGGAGMLEALGAVLLDDAGGPLPRGGGPLRGLGRLDLSGLPRQLGRVRFVLAADVDSPLLGPLGAAAVFAPQKGADAAQIDLLDQGLQRWADAVEAATGTDAADRPGAGAAGGTGFAALAVLGATVRPGIDLVLELLDVHSTVTSADLVITGEGRLDRQSLAGKAPIGVARVARSHGVPVVAVTGASELSPAEAQGAGLSAVYTLSDLEPHPARSLANARALLIRAAGLVLADRSR